LVEWIKYVTYAKQKIGRLELYVGSGENVVIPKIPEPTTIRLREVLIMTIWVLNNESNKHFELYIVSIFNGQRNAWGSARNIYIYKY